MTMREFKKYLDNLITLKENYIFENKRFLITTYYGKIAGISEYERQRIILKEYKDIRKVIEL